MPSDSLFAALAAVLARTKGGDAVAKFCEPFIGENSEPPFVLSSTYPFAGEVRFFPVPMRARGGDAQGVSAKKLKKVEFLSDGVFRSVLAGEPLADLFDENRTLQGGKILANQADFERLPAELRSPSARVWVAQSRPRVTLDRSSSASNLFHIGQVHFAEGCGLWFGVRWDGADESKKAELKNMIHELAAAGFGAERTTGLGIAEVEESGALDLPDARGAWVTLSRYLPREDEIDSVRDEKSAYAIKAVGGWLDSPKNMGQRRRQVNLIEEGSVIGGVPQRLIPGRVADVRPSYETDPDPLGHPVYRFGLALAVGMEGGAG
jgi:CRISPR-associated protein Csm4